MLHEQGGDIDRPELVIGARVRVVRDPESDGPWPDEPVGTIEPVYEETPYVTSDSEWGKVRQFKVHFDVPQRDADGQGPYSGAMIWQQYLVALPSENG